MIGMSIPVFESAVFMVVFGILSLLCIWGLHSDQSAPRRAGDGPEGQPPRPGRPTGSEPGAVSDLSDWLRDLANRLRRSSARRDRRSGRSDPARASL